MSVATRTVTASELATVADCEARLFHDRQRYRDGLLPTDRVAADLSSVVHDAVMEVHRRMETRLREGKLPDRADVRKRLQAEITRGLFRKNLATSDPSVAERLGRMDAGLDRVADLVLDDAPGWALDSRSGDALVWVEGPLDHGPAIPAVEIAPGRLVRTRPDVIGLRRLDSGLYCAVVRDFKVRNQPVIPQSDYGILVRGLWVLAEAKNPRCRWFIAGRDVAIDLNGIDLEIVNLMYADTDNFLVRARLSEANLLSLGAHVVETLDRAEYVAAATSPDDVEASPSEFCQTWCPYLNRCAPGTDWVRRYKGEDALQARMADAR